MISPCYVGVGFTVHISIYQPHFADPTTAQSDLVIMVVAHQRLPVTCRWTTTKPSGRIIAADSSSITIPKWVRRKVRCIKVVTAGKVWVLRIGNFNTHCFKWAELERTFDVFHVHLPRACFHSLRETASSATGRC